MHIPAPCLRSYLHWPRYTATDPGKLVKALCPPNRFLMLELPDRSHEEHKICGLSDVSREHINILIRSIATLLWGDID